MSQNSRREKTLWSTGVEKGADLGLNTYTQAHTQEYLCFEVFEIDQAQTLETISGVFPIFVCGCHIKNMNYETSL